MTLATNDTVTGWLHGLGDGDETAARKLWERYSRRLQELARRRLRNMERRIFDEEDVALSAFGHFCAAVQDGRYQDMEGRDDLWRLLAAITGRKAQQRMEEAGRQKRGGDFHPSPIDLDDVAGNDPAPEVLALLTDQCRYFLANLSDDELRRVAIMKLEGYTNKEIAERLGFSRQTIQRMVSVVRVTWEDLA